MNLLRKILFPFSAIYGGITWFRNFLYDKNILQATEFDIPVIAVGNLSVGGTGKSPQVEYLIRLLSPDYKVATLSRGYKRRSSGYVLADARSTAETLGDEPFQFYSKFPRVNVAVDANRVNGITKLLQLPTKPDVILLDDAFQHRKVRAGFYILLTAFNDLYSDDFLLPAGNLRESRRGAKRASVIVVTKCPPDLPIEKQLAIRLRLKLKAHQQLFFSYIAFDSDVKSASGSIPLAEISHTKKVLIAGIAKPESFFGQLQNDGDTVLRFSDHHNFSDSDIAAIKKQAGRLPIVTTEKDFMRLQGRLPESQLYYLPIRSTFISESSKFDKTINDYVGKSSTNR